LFKGKPLFRRTTRLHHLRKKEIYRTTKLQKPVKLSIDNIQMSSIRDIGKKLKQYKACQYWHNPVENIYQRSHRIYLEDIASSLDPSYKKLLFLSSERVHFLSQRKNA
jgi:hypothetical protein